jgi:hypothetical protein
MTISNETGHDRDGQDRGGWEDLFQLQAQYSAKLTEEALKYLRSMQSALSPRPPGSVVRADGRRLTGRGAPGGRIRLDVTIENRQRVHTPVSPSVSPFVGDDGTTWYPVVAFEPIATIVAPDDTKQITATVDVPGDLEPGRFVGSIMLHGFVADGVPVEITVIASEPVE